MKTICLNSFGIKNGKEAEVREHILIEQQYRKGPVPYTNPTQQLGRVVISWYMGLGVATTVGSFFTTDLSGRET